MEIAPVLILLVPMVLGTVAGLLTPRRMPVARLIMMALLAIATTGVLISLTTGLLAALFSVGVAVGRAISNRRQHATEHSSTDLRSHE